MDSKHAPPIRSDDAVEQHTTPDNFNGIHLVAPALERSVSTSTVEFRSNYDTLLKEITDDGDSNDVDLDGAVEDRSLEDVYAAAAGLSDELRAAIEDRSLGDEYLAELKRAMSHRRTQSHSSIASATGDFATPAASMPTPFTQPLHSKPLFSHHQDPLVKVLDAVPYDTRLVNGVQSLANLEQKFRALQIPELDLPTVSDTIIRSRLDDMYMIQDDLYIHLHGGPLVQSVTSHIGDKNRIKVMHLLDEIGSEIGVYEQFNKRADYLNMESILNEADEWDLEEEQSTELFETESSLAHFDSSSDLSRVTPGTPASPITQSISPNSFSGRTSASPKAPRRINSQPTLASLDSVVAPRHNISSPGNSSGSVHSSDFGNLSDMSPSMSQLLGDGSTARGEGTDVVEPHEAFKWSPLLKISDQIYSDDVQNSYGLVSVLAVSGVIAIGTTRSLVFVYDYSQSLKCVLGDESHAADHGAVTSIAISAEHATIACGHSEGYIVVWDIRKPSQPIRIIAPIPENQLLKNHTSSAAASQGQASRKEGHVKGASILHVGFVGVKKTEIVSGDDRGMAFYHVLYKVVMVNGVETTRILGRYQNLAFPSDSLPPNGAGSDTMNIPKPRRPITVFAMQPLPLGQLPHAAEQFKLVALLTPYKMIIVGLKPTPQTQYKFFKPKAFTTSSNVSADGAEDVPLDSQTSESKDHASQMSESLSGCLAWLPVTKSNSKPAGEAEGGKDKKTIETPTSGDPMLAFAWGNQLYILRVRGKMSEPLQGNGRLRPSLIGKNSKYPKLEFIEHRNWTCQDPIVALQWVSRQILVLFTPNEEMILFDPKNMMEMERASIGNKQPVYHNWFGTALKNLVTNQDTVPGHHSFTKEATRAKSVEVAYYQSLKCYKGTLFLLGLKQVYIGAFLSWSDRILALVRSGDFLEAIELATRFYNGKCIQTVVGFPEHEETRKQVVGEKLMELLTASLNYAFSSVRTYEGMTDEIAGGSMALYRDLATVCIEACLSMANLTFLFETVYERFAHAGVNGAFLEVLGPYIIQHQVSDVPPAIMKDLVDHFGDKKLLQQLEQVIWHVDPASLDIDQVVNLCHREGLYEAMIYVWNKSMDDYVSPMVEMIKDIRKVIKEENTRRAESTQMMRSASSETVMQATELRRNTEKIFDYLKCTLSGRSFPDGNPMASTRARSAVYSFIFSGPYVIWPARGGKYVMTADDDKEDSEITYPYLRLLLRLNTKKFLDALREAFKDPWLSGGDDILTSTFEDETRRREISRQIIINALLDVMGGALTNTGLAPPPPQPRQSTSASTVQSMSHGSAPNSDTASSQDAALNNNIVQLYMFIANSYSEYSTFILLKPMMWQKILECLAETNNYITAEERKEREEAVINILKGHKPTDEDKMILMYEDAGFWKVLEAMYRGRKMYGKLVETFLKDDARGEEVFECVHELLRPSSGLDEKQRSEVRRAFLVRISTCVEINGQKTAETVEQYFDGDHTDIIQRLEEDRQEFKDEGHQATVDKRLFSYLHGLLEPHSGETLLDQDALAQDPPELRAKVSLQERYLELMCRFDPSGVYHFLNTKLSPHVNLDTILKCCEEHGVMDAVVWILEKSGDTLGALEKTLGVAKDNVTLILSRLKDHANKETLPWSFEDQTTISSCLVRLNGVVRVATQICEMSSRSSMLTSVTETPDDTQLTELVSKENEDNESDRVESLWFQLLDTYVESSIEICTALGAMPHDRIQTGLREHITSSFKSFIQSILTPLVLSTAPQVSLPRLLSRLIDSQTRGETTFADFRDIFMSMLDMYKYEGMLLELTNRLFGRDLFVGVDDMVKRRGRGWQPRGSTCHICHTPILDPCLIQPPLGWKDERTEEEMAEDALSLAEKKDVTLFHCGHVYHRHCLSLQLGDSQACVACHDGGDKSGAKTAIQAKGKAKAL